MRRRGFHVNGDAVPTLRSGSKKGLVGVAVDYDAAEERLDEAVRLARAQESLTDKWIETAADLDISPCRCRGACLSLR